MTLSADFDARSELAREAIRRAQQEAERLARWLPNYGDECVYCGAAPVHRDHLVPRSVATGDVRLMVPTAPACGSCNSILGDYFEPRVQQRARMVAHRLYMKHRRWLDSKSEELTDDDILDLGEFLAGQVIRLRYERNEIRRRLRVLKAGGLLRAGGLS